MGLKQVAGSLTNGVLGVFGLRLSRGRRGSWSHERSAELLHSRCVPGASYSPWLSDREFLAAYEKIRDFTLVDIYRCYELWSFARDANRVEGVILEVGVWRGGTGCLLAQAAQEKTIYLADTFEGVVNAGAEDTRYVGGEHADTSEEIVRRLLADSALTNVRILKGIFPSQTAQALTGPIALLHVDVDVYQSAKDTVDWSLSRIPVGGKIVFDDYGFFGCEGVTRLVNQYHSDLQDFAFVHNLNGHAVLIRTERPALAG